MTAGELGKYAGVCNVKNRGKCEGFSYVIYFRGLRTPNYWSCWNMQRERTTES